MLPSRGHRIIKARLETTRAPAHGTPMPPSLLRALVLCLTILLVWSPFPAWSQNPPAAPGASPPPAENDQLASAAMAAFDAGNFQESCDKLDQLLSKDEIRNAKDPKILQALEAVFYVKAASLYNLNRHEEAVKAFGAYLATFSQGKRRDDAIFSLAGCYIALKKSDEALAELKKLEEVSEFRDEALLLQAGIYYENKDFKSAVRPLTLLVEKGLGTSASIRAAIMLGSVYSQLGQFDKATALLTDIRRNFDRVDNKAQFNATVLQLGDKLYNAGLPREAQFIYEMVQTKEELLAAQKTAIARKQKETALALETFRQTKDISALRQRNRLLNEIKQDESSLDVLEKTPDFMLSVLIRRGRAYAEFGRQHEAIIIYDHIIEKFPDAKAERDVAAFSRILAFVELAKVDSAIEAATFYLDHFPTGQQRDTATYLRGALSLDANNPQKAAGYFGAALAEADEGMKKSALFPKMLFLLGVAKFSLNDYPGAAGQFAEYTRSFPGGDFVQEAGYRTALCTLFGDKEIGYKKALHLFEDYLQKYPSGDFAADAGYRIALCHMSAGEHETVVKGCDEWLRKRPGDQMSGEVLALKADAILALGNKAAAAACYNESAMAATSDEVLMYSLMEAAKLYQDLADWPAMDTMFRKFLVKYPDHPGSVAAFYYIGQAMIKQGKIPEGKAFLAEKIRGSISDPHKEAVERLLTQLAQLCAKKPKMPPEPASPPASEPTSPAPATGLPSPAPTARPKPDPSIELEEFLVTFPDTPAAKARKLFVRSELATMRRKPDESAKYLDQLVDTVPPEDLSPMLLGKVGDMLLARGDEARAREMYDQIIGGFSRSEFADYGYVGRGELAMRKGKFEEALKCFSFAADEMAASSKLKEATLGKAKALLALKKYPEAEKIFEMIAGLKEWRGEATAESLLCLGRIAQENKDYPKAIAYYQRIFLTHQKYPKIVAQAYMDSAACFKELGKPVEAKNTYAEMLRNEKLRTANTPELAEAQKQFDQIP